MSDRVTLAECPIGLFVADGGELCLKTEYGDNEGRIDAYIVSSGEFFWGGAKTRQEQRKVLVTPYDHATALAEAEREGMRRAAEIAKSHKLGEGSFLAGTGTWAIHDGACNDIAAAILSEAGIAVTD